MDKQQVIFRDLGNMDYKTAWDYQEKLLQENTQLKTEFVIRNSELVANENLSTYKEPVTSIQAQLQLTTCFSSNILLFIPWARAAILKMY